MLRPRATPTPGVVHAELLKTKHLAIQVKIDGRGPFRLIFDTGSPVVLINSRVAKECKLFESGRKVSGGIGMWPGQVVLKSMEAGGATAESVPAVVIDHPTVKAIEKLTGPIDGIVGFPFFARFRTEVDYSVPQLRLTPNGHQPPDAMASMMRAFFERSGVPRRIAATGQWGLELDTSLDDEAGVVVRQVFPNTAAAAAGLLAGDRLLTIDGRWTDSADDAVRAAADVPADMPAKVVVQRGGRELAAFPDATTRLLTSPIDHPIRQGGSD